MNGGRMTVDARALDLPHLRSQGIGRYAHGLLGPLTEIAAAHGVELLALREAGGPGSAFNGADPAETGTRSALDRERSAAAGVPGARSAIDPERSAAAPAPRSAIDPERSAAAPNPPSAVDPEHSAAASDPASAIAPERRAAAGAQDPLAARALRLRRAPVPERLAELPDQLRLPLALRRARSRLHHALSIYGAPLAPGVPLVVTVHDVVPLQWPELYLRTGVVHRMLYRAVRRAAAVIAVSRAARDDLLRHLPVEPERVTVVHEGVDARFRPVDATGVRARLKLGERPYLLYVGGLAQHDPRKGLEELVDAFARSGRAETLVIAGRIGPAGEALADGARRAGARVEFPGFVPEHELPALYSGAACFITASRYEGFGLPALEAIACGTPVVAYDAGAIPEVAGPGALLAPPSDHHALMRNAARLCDDAELRARLAAAGREHAAAVTWERAAERTWHVYERALQG